MRIKSVKTGGEMSVKSVNSDTVVPIRSSTPTVQKGRSPYINEETSTWFVFDDNAQMYVDTGVKASVDIDAELSDESTNPVQNRVITKEVNTKIDDDDIKQLNAIDIDMLWEAL